MQPKVGDRVGLDAKKVGQPVRVGVVERVSAGLAGARYEIRWEDGSASIMAPAAGTLKVLGRPKAKAKPPRAKAKAGKPKAKSPKAKAKAGKPKAKAKAKGRKR